MEDLRSYFSPALNRPQNRDSGQLSLGDGAYGPGDIEEVIVLDDGDIAGPKLPNWQSEYMLARCVSPTIYHIRSCDTWYSLLAMKQSLLPIYAFREVLLPLVEYSLGSRLLTRTPLKRRKLSIGRSVSYRHFMKHRESP